MLKKFKKIDIPWSILGLTAFVFALLFPLPRYVFGFFTNSEWVLSSMIVPISKEEFGMAWFAPILILPITIPALFYSFLFLIELFFVHLLTKRLPKFIFWILGIVGGCVVVFAINTSFAKTDLSSGLRFAEAWEQMLITIKVHKLQGDWLKIGISKKEFNSHLRLSSLVRKDFTKDFVYGTDEETLDYHGLTDHEQYIATYMFKANDCYTFNNFYHFCFSQEKLFLYKQFKQSAVFHPDYKKSLLNVAKIDFNSFVQCEKVNKESPYYLGNFSIDVCYGWVARNTSYAPPICEKFSTIEQRDDCYNSRGLETQDLAVCNKIENLHGKSYCAMDIIINKNNPDACLTLVAVPNPRIINSISAREVCINSFVKKDNSVSYCEKYYDPETTDGLKNIIKCYDQVSEPLSLEFCKRKWNLNLKLYHDAQFAEIFTVGCESDFIINKAKKEKNIALCTSPQLSNPILLSGKVFECIKPFVIESKDISYCDRYLEKTTDQERMNHRSCYELLLNDPPSAKYCSALRDFMNEDRNKEYAKYTPFSYEVCIASLKEYKL